MALGFSSWRDALDIRLRKVGQDVVLKRNLAGGSNISVTCRAFARTTKPQEDPRGLNAAQISGPLTVPDMHVIISGTELDAKGWPLTDGLPLPLRSDTITVAGRDRSVQVVVPILVQNVLARIEMTVRG